MRPGKITRPGACTRWKTSNRSSGSELDKLVISNRAKKDLKRLDQQDQVKVHTALDKLAESEEGDIKPGSTSVSPDAPTWPSGWKRTSMPG